MTKQLLILFPYKFTNFEYYKYELKKFKYKISILDFSYANKKFVKNAWKSSRHPKVFAPKSLKSLLNFFRHIIKKRPIILNLNDEEINLWTILVKFIIKKNNLNEIVINEKSWVLPIKKNFGWLKNKILEHGFNFKVYFFYIQFFLGKFILSFLKHKNEFIFSNTKTSKYYINNYDYSNSLASVKRKTKKKYIVFLDNGGPYFSADTERLGNILPNRNIKKIYSDINNFFFNLEKIFKCKIVIIPHPKYKSSNKKKSFNPYFKNFIVDNRPNAINILSNEIIFFLSKGSSASSYAAIFQKPVIFFYSSNHHYVKNELGAIKDHAKILGTKAFNIENFCKKNFLKLLKFDKKKYKQYINQHLAPNKKLKNKPNFFLISSFIKSIKN